MKLRKAEPGADAFNNVPRYDLAAYELQKLFLDPAEYVVPPTALRMIPRADFAKYQADVARTFSSAEQVLAVVQYWLSDITVVADVLDPARFESDALYARHIGQLNVLTFLIEHRDSNVGNFLHRQVADRRPRVLDRSRRGLRVHRQRSRRGVEADPRQPLCRPMRSRDCAPSRCRSSSSAWACWRNGAWKAIGSSRSRSVPTCRRVAACVARARTCRWD